MNKHKITTFSLIQLIFLLTSVSSVEGAQTATPAATADSSATTTIAGCAVFPADNPWNQDVSKLVLSRSRIPITGLFGSLSSET